jgi:type III secretory pathway component EscT
VGIPIMKKKQVERIIPVIVLLLIYMPSYYFIVPLFKNQKLGNILMTLICIAITGIITSKIEKK